MRVNVKLFAQYREGRFKTKEMILGENVKVDDIFTDLNLQNSLPLGIVLINSKHATLKSLLKDGDTLSLFPKVGGG